MAIALFLGARRRVLARDVADKFDISLRTVYRDIRALAAAGFPVEGNAGDGYRLPQESYLSPLALTSDEAEVLALAALALAASVTGPLQKSLARATSKLEATLDRPTYRRVHDLQTRVVVPAMVRRTAGPTAEILEAIRQRQVASFAYPDAKGKNCTRHIEPLGLVCRGDAWWVVAYCRDKQDARAFRVERIASWVSSTTRFDARPGLSFADIVRRDQHLAERLFGY